ncbi:hypothetical protein N751_11530 [Legionella pneumophila str. Leg01/11]|nr:hypothetical protein N751_11530 [Legionella pneumophila str. Leg01/11]
MIDIMKFAWASTEGRNRNAWINFQFDYKRLTQSNK